MIVDQELVYSEKHNILSRKCRSRPCIKQGNQHNNEIINHFFLCHIRHHFGLVQDGLLALNLYVCPLDPIGQLGVGEILGIPHVPWSAFRPAHVVHNRWWW